MRRLVLSKTLLRYSLRGLSRRYARGFSSSTGRHDDDTKVQSGINEAQKRLQLELGHGQNETSASHNALAIDSETVLEPPSTSALVISAGSTVVAETTTTTEPSTETLENNDGSALQSDQQPHPVTPSASIPFMITRPMKVVLTQQLGFSRHDVRVLTPQLAHEIIEFGIDKNAAMQVVQEQEEHQEKTALSDAEALRTALETAVDRVKERNLEG